MFANQINDDNNNLLDPNEKEWKNINDQQVNSL